MKNLFLVKWVFFIQFIFTIHSSWGINSLTLTLNPWFNSISPSSFNIEGLVGVNQVFEPLVKVSPDGNITGGVIKSWSMSADYKTFHFKLNPNIYFSDGTLLTSKHIQQMFNEALRYHMFEPFERILVAQNYQQKKTKTMVGLKVINEQEFIIKSTKPFPNLLLQLASSNFYVFLQQKKTNSSIGTGPYMVTKFDKPNELLILQKNPYYNRKNFYYDQVIFNHKVSINTDISETSPEKNDLNLFNLKEYFVSQLYALGFNANNKKLENLQYRKFLTCLLPTKKFNYKHDSFIPIGIFGYNYSLHFNCDNSNSPPVGLSKNYTITYYLDSLAETAKNYCDILKSNSIQCTIQKIENATKLKKLKDNNSLEIFLARFKSTVALAGDLFASFMKYHPINFFDTGHTVFAYNFEKTFEKLYGIPPTSKKDLMNIYTELNELIINNYMARPISYGVEEKLWIKKNIYVPDISIMGITSLDLTEVKPQPESNFTSDDNLLR